MGEYKEDKNTPYFSIVLPIYNVEEYLKACVESVLSQGFQDYELILVDDGSTDGCPAICNDYAEKYSNISVIHKKNGGLSSARNAGLDVAQGQYIWWVDSDDWIEEGALEKLWNISCESLPDMVKFGYCRSGEKAVPVESGIRPGTYSREKGLEELVDRAFYHAGAFCLSAWSHVYRRDFISRNALSFVSERIVGSEDYLFNLQALPLADSVTVIENRLYFYRLRSGSLSQDYRDGLAEKYTKLWGLLEENYKKTGNYPCFREKLNYFYAWHLIYGTCISREYRPDGTREIYTGRETVKKILSSRPLQAALAGSAKAGLSRKRRILYMAMRMKFEPFLYWLFVIKPKRELKRHENQN